MCRENLITNDLPCDFVYIVAFYKLQVFTVYQQRVNVYRSVSFHQTGPGSAEVVVASHLVASPGK